MGWYRWTLDVHPDDRNGWKQAAAVADLTLAEWTRGILNLAAGLPVRRNGRRKKLGRTPLDDLVLPTAESLGSVGVLPGAAACSHVQRGGFCNRCGAVRQ